MNLLKLIYTQKVCRRSKIYRNAAENGNNYKIITHQEIFGKCFRLVFKPVEIRDKSE